MTMTMTHTHYIHVHAQETEEEEEVYRRELEYTAEVAAENPKNYQVWCA
jgi:hypothetical protein